jgi:hypothetical protein
MVSCFSQTEIGPQFLSGVHVKKNTVSINQTHFKTTFNFNRSHNSRSKHPQIALLTAENSSHFARIFECAET